MFTIIGGRPRLEIKSLTITGVLPVSDEQLQTNLDYGKSLDLPGITRVLPPTPLAVVGGGPSIKQHVETLRNWRGDVLAVNGAFGWCRDNGIDAIFYGVDPHPIVAKWGAGARRAILATQCHPETFGALKDADVQAFVAGEKIKGGGSAVSSGPWLAAQRGNSSVTLFGCECSFLNVSHAYQDEARTDRLVVECGGEEYLTASDFYRYAQELSLILREGGKIVPGYIKEESGGLLRAMIQNETYRIKWLSEELAKGLKA